jgi:hypothetical protein
VLNRSFTAQLTAVRVPLRIRVTTARRPALSPPPLVCENFFIISHQPLHASTLLRAYMSRLNIALQLNRLRLIIALRRLRY